MFFTSLRLPFKILEIFFFVYFGVFWPEKCICEVFDQISDVRGLDSSVFIYGDYSTCHIVLQRMVTYKMEGPAKTVMLEKLGLVPWIKISIFIKLFGKNGRISFWEKSKART